MMIVVKVSVSVSLWLEQMLQNGLNYVEFLKKKRKWKWRFQKQEEIDKNNKDIWRNVSVFLTIQWKAMGSNVV